MFVTMFTDASWNPSFGIGVWAMWAKMNGKTIRYSGKVRQQVDQIGTAELAAIANGLFCVKRRFQLTDGSKVLVQTDSQEAIHAIQSRDHRRRADRELAVYIKDFAKANGLKLELRHVKGHQGDTTPRNAVNTWCDRECRRLLKTHNRERTDLQLELPLSEVA